MMGNGRCAVTAIRLKNRIHALEFTVVLLPFQRVEHFGDEIVDVKKLERDRRIVYGDGEIAGDVVAEGGHGRVVVRAAPLAEEVREAVDKHLCTRFLSIGEEELLARLFAAAVVAVVAADAGGLDRRGEHHGGFVPVLLQFVKQR